MIKPSEWSSSRLYIKSSWNFCTMQMHGWQHSLWLLCDNQLITPFPTLLWHCWLGDRKDIQPVKSWMLLC